MGMGARGSRLGVDGMEGENVGRDSWSGEAIGGLCENLMQWKLLEESDLSEDSSNAKYRVSPVHLL